MNDSVRSCPYCGEKVDTAITSAQCDLRCAVCGNSFAIHVPNVSAIGQKDTQAKEKKSALILLQEALALMEQGDHTAAVIKLNVCARKFPDRVDVLMTLGKACSMANISYEALSAYKKVLDINPLHEEALFKASTILIQQKQYQQGIDTLKRLIELNPLAEQAKLMLNIAAIEKQADTDQLATTRDSTTFDRSADQNRLPELFALFKSADRTTWVMVCLWLALPVAFAVVYQHGLNGVQTGYLLMAILLYNVFLGVVTHELGHGVTAFLLGDDTAKGSGRLTFNPVKHISVTGTIIVPISVYLLTGMTFGWAKPVPFNPMRLYRQPRDQAVVAGAGPFTSFVLSYLMFNLFLVLAYIHNNYYPSAPVEFTIDLVNPFDVGAGSKAALWFVALELSAIGAVVNLVLGVFNLIPVPPLDGSWLLKAALPPSVAIALDRVRWAGFAIIIACVYFGWIIYLFYPAYFVLAGYFTLSNAIL